MSYTTIDDPTKYFDIALYSGTGSSRTISYDFEVDFFWCKMRNDVYPHNWYDSSRGTNAGIRSNQNTAEVSHANTASFGNASGVTLGTDSGSHGVNQQLNDSSAQAIYVGYAWKVNGGSTTTNDASATGVGSIDSVYQANTTTGFSIVTYTGTGTTATVAHGLGGVPDMLIFKKRSTTDNWYMYHSANTAAPETDYMTFDTTAATTDFNIWNDTAPTSTVFSISNAGVHADTTTMVCYAWREIQGYSKFGGYTGNGNADGTFVYTGFKPAFVITKMSDTGGDNWHILDHKRDIDNPAVQVLQNNEPDAEGTTTTSMLDFLSNGFKCRGTGSSINTNATDYIYIAFAEQPFVTSGGVPCTAR